ncbi:NAD-dependent epimerase/dehydratase family protein [Cecembia sp.]|uniref:NAD-dependent epimerase/dehydratase family protein n=1 Tax=Cecembia sp. TaxID=1898110 RepID=UPI0025B9D453|nr:NAD-dependent epimerase/dehydratase family protein [Cecembia sp.]
MKKTFITGASGFLGHNLVQEMIKQGYFVKALTRDLENYRGTSHANLQLIQGDALKIQYSLLSDCDVVFHLVGETTPNLPYSSYNVTNVESSLILLNAALENGVKRFVFVSTANTIGYANNQVLGSEEMPIRYPYDQSSYALSKLKAEELLLEYKDKIDILIANPTFMIGAFDYKPTSNRIIKDALFRKIIFYPPGGKNFVPVKDVVIGLISMIERGKNGEKYILAGENLSFRDFYLKFARQANTKPTLIKIPKLLMKLLGWIGDLLLKMRVKTALSTLNMEILCLNNFYTNDKSQRVLKLRYRPIEEAILDSIDFFQNEKQ